MALINCKDCHSEVSDSAESCPKCGAPIPRTIGPDEEQCPHCMTVVHQDATTCPGCRAKKGYATNANGVLGKPGMIFGGLVVPIPLMVVFPPAAIVLIPVMLFSVYRLKTGPVWYAAKNPS